MNTHKWLLPILLSVLIIQSTQTTFVSSSDTTLVSNDWIMFRHDPAHTAYVNSTDLTNSYKTLWTYKTSGMIKSSPAIANGCIVVGSRDWNIYCLNANTGKLIWNYSTGNEVNSSPAFSNNSVYVGSDDGYLYCIDLTRGTLIWKSIIGGKIRSSPAIFENQVYVGSGNHDVFCLNASDGSKIWSYPTLKGIQSSPAISDGAIYFASDDYFVYSLNAFTGNEIWRTHTGSVISSPSIYNGQVYIGSIDGYVYCLNASTGSKIWAFKTQDSVSSSPAIAYGSIYIGCEDNNVYCLNASNGKKIWQNNTGYWVRSSPVVAADNVYVGSEDYNIYCFDAFTGEKKWSFATENYVDSSPAVVDNNLFVGSSDWNIIALELTDSNIDPIQLQVSKALPWTIIVFDIIFAAIILTSIFIILRFVLENRRTKHQTNLIELEDKESWFSKHSNVLCILGILVFSVIFFVNLENGPLWVSDEKTYSQWAYHMVKEGDYLTPWASGDLAMWIGKPPLLMWLMSIAYQVFGVNTFASRIWSPIFGTLSLVLVFFLGKKLYNLYVGFLSAIILGLFSSFYVFARHAMIDVPFVFFMLVSVYFLLLSVKREDSNRYVVLGGLFFGLAFMTKQITALLIPLVVFFYFIGTGRGVKFLFSKRFALFWRVGVLLVSPWVIYMVLRFGPEFWETFFVYSGVIRAITPIEGHTGGYLFYFESLVRTENLFLVGLLVFSVGLNVFNSVIRRLKEDILIFVWIFIVFLVFTFAQTKLEWYILPAFPAFAISISSFLYKLSKKIRYFVQLIYLRINCIVKNVFEKVLGDKRFPKKTA